MAKKTKKVSAATRRHADFLLTTLGPDIKAGGREFLAKDAMKCGRLMKAGRTDARYASWLKSTLIPDLRASGQKDTAQDFVRCARAITPAKPYSLKRSAESPFILQLGRKRKR